MNKLFIHKQVYLPGVRLSSARMHSSVTVSFELTWPEPSLRSHHHAIIALMHDRGSFVRSTEQKNEASMALEHRRTMTVEEYFLLEKNDPDTCYEYIDGSTTPG